jgi:hypothetical protein
MIAALNHTGDYQRSESTTTVTGSVRASWVSNPTLSSITVRRSGTYVILAQTRMGGFDSTNDKYFQAALFLGGVTGIRLTAAMGGMPPANTQLTLGDHSMSLSWVGHLSANDDISLLYWVYGPPSGATDYSFYSDGNGNNKVEIFLVHPDSANLLTASSSGGYSSPVPSVDLSALIASTASLTSRVTSLESATSSLFNAKVNFSLGVLGGTDSSTIASDYQETTRNLNFVPRTSPTIVVPVGGNGSYFISAAGRILNLADQDTFWLMGIRLTRGSVISYPCQSLSDVPSPQSGISRGDNTRTCSYSGQLLAGDLLQISYYVYSSGEYNPTCSLAERVFDVC